MPEPEFGDQPESGDRFAGPDGAPDAAPDPAPDSDSEGGDEDDIPPAPLWAMRVRMHSRRHPGPGEEGRIRRCLGEGDEALYVIDDGPDHCMVGRRVGRASDGCTYCLVARVPLEHYADLEAGDAVAADAFSGARDIALCGVFEQDRGASNVFVVQHYRRGRDVPADYLAPSPFIEFTDDRDDVPDSWAHPGTDLDPELDSDTDPDPDTDPDLGF